MMILTMVTAFVTTDVNAENGGARTTSEVKGFVEKAAVYARSHSKAEALKAFTEKEGQFRQGSLYIFAYDFSGNVIAHGGDASLVGRNLLGMKDPNGVEVIKELVRLARNGSGWLYYTWPNPEHAGKQEPKLGYVVKIDDGWFIGSGTYGPAAVKP
jgi:signal transduction histidine kinase